MSNAGVTKLSGVSVQVASFASTLDLPTSELVAVVSLNLGQSDRIAVLRQVLEADGLSTIITNEDTLGVIGVQVDIDGLLDLGLFLVSLKLVADISHIIIVARSVAIHLGPQQSFSACQIRGAICTITPLTAFSLRGRRSNSIFFQSNTLGLTVFRKVDDNLLTRSRIGRRCKRCKRHAHDNHEHGSQQSQQTSFEVRFLHVNFSYSLKFI